jgi:hypothetical protein
MKAFLQKNHRLAFYGTWLLLGLMQAGLTELQDDEAYYWVYGQYLDWGYFDHPPMIALLVKMGSSILPGELGVRLFPLLLNVFTLLIIEKLIDKKNPLLFYAIALSMAVISLMGFMAVPDTPLIFFTALFFLCYKRFIGKNSFLNMFLLGLSIAFLFYSKYHAVLVVLFVVISNPRLFLKYKFWLAGLIAFLLYVPHLWWQEEHGWVSFRYHLFESNVNAYKPSFTLEYIAGQFFLPGPIAGLILLPAAILYKPKTSLERSLRFAMIGIYGFFLLSSFRGKVEANWTSPALVPLIILSHQYLNEKLKWQKLLFKLLPITLFLVLFARVVMIVDIVPLKAIKERFHSWKDWPAEMKKRTKGLPIVFSNSYQRASKYWFYTGQMTLSQNLYTERKNNYNFWPVEKEMLLKPVYLLDIYPISNPDDSLKTPIGLIRYRYDSSFLSYGTCPIRFSFRSSMYEKDSLVLRCFSDMYNRMHRIRDTANENPYSVSVVFFQNKKVVAEKLIALDLNELQGKSATVITIFPGLPKGKYKLMFSVAVPGYNPTHNSDKMDLKVESDVAH